MAIEKILPLPAVKLECPRCHKFTMIEVDFSIPVKFFFITKTIKIHLQYDPSCGFNKVKVEF